MREIKFRGRSIKSGMFIIGALLIMNGKSYICDSDTGDLDDIDFGWLFEEAMSETVGQLTGLKDKNGIEIYEGDIVNDRIFGVCEIKYLHNSFVLWDRGSYSRDHSRYLGSVSCEVIGNIYENPELLK